MHNLLNMRTEALSDDYHYCVISQPIGHPQHACLHVVEQQIQQIYIESEYDEHDCVPEVVDEVCSIESDEQAL